MTDEQLWLPFDFIHELEEEEQIDLSGLSHYENPSNDNEHLLELQYQYKVNGKQEALAEFYTKAVRVCEKIINQKARRNRFIKRLNEEEREEKAVDATNYIIEKFLKEPNWYIKSNVPAYLYLRVLKELYYRSQGDALVNFVEWETFKEEAIEIDEDEEVAKRKKEEAEGESIYKWKNFN